MNDRRVVVEINIGSSSTVRPIFEPLEDEGETEEKKRITASELSQWMIHPLKSFDNFATNNLQGKSAFFLQAYEQVKNVVENTIETGLNRYFSLSEDYIAENDYRNIKVGISKVQGLASSVVTGAMVGGPAGAIGGAFAWGINEAINLYNTRSNFEKQMNTVNYNKQYNSTRASLVDNSEGTDN